MTTGLDSLDESADVDDRLRQQLEEVCRLAVDRAPGDSLQRLAEIARESLACSRASIRMFYDDDAGAGCDLAAGVAQDVAEPDATGWLHVPVMLRGSAVGELLVAGPNAGFADTFDVHQRRRAEAVAVAAGIVVERVRTAAANLRRDAWYESGTVLAKQIVSARGEDDPYQAIVERVHELAGAESTSLLQLGNTADSWVIAAATGPDAANFLGQEILVPNSLATEVMATGRATTVDRLGDINLPDDLRRRLPDTSVTMVPLVGSGVQRGLLCITRAVDREPMSAAEVGMATAFGATIALALELAESQAARDELVLVEERDRIARDLHDHVIQRLYAIGLTVQSIANGLTGDTEQRLIRGVDDIDETIKQIRATIFQLTTPLISSKRSLRVRAEDLLDELTPALGFRPRLVTNGPVDFGVDEVVIDDCDAVLREAVTNVARHAAATEAEVAISVSAAQLRLEVRDDGRGLGATARRSGLANLRSRAEKYDGFMQVRSVGGSGTWLLWSIPLPNTESDY